LLFRKTIAPQIAFAIADLRTHSSSRSAANHYPPSNIIGSLKLASSVQWIVTSMSSLGAVGGQGLWRGNEAEGFA
jgi:hypothetical protein